MGNFSSFGDLEENEDEGKIISVSNGKTKNNIKNKPIAIVGEIDDGIDQQTNDNSNVDVKSNILPVPDNDKTDEKKCNNNDELINIINNGNEFYKNKKYNESIIQYSAAININNNDHLLYFKRSNCYRRLNKYKEAYIDINKCIQIKPEWIKGYGSAGYILFKLTKYDDAKRVYQHGLQLNPKNKICQIGIKDCDKEINKQIKEDIITKLKQLYTPVYIQRAFEIFEKKSNSASNYDINEIIIIIFRLQEEDNIKTDAAKAKINGNNYYSIKEWNLAIKEYNIAIGGYNNSYILYYNRGKCYLNLSQYSQSLNDGYKCISLNINCIAAYCLTGESLIHLKRYSEAKEIYSKGLNIEKNNIELFEGKMKCDKLIQEIETKKLQNELNELKKKKIELEQKTQYQAKKISNFAEKEKKLIKLQKENININIAWHWIDEYNQWNPYNEDIMRQLECLGVDQSIEYKCSHNKQNYIIMKLSDSTGYQMNKQTSVRRNVRRIRRVKNYPQLWDQMYCNDNTSGNYTKCVLMTMNIAINKEAQAVRDHFYKTVNVNHVKIVKIECVQNKYLWDRYFNAKQILIKHIGTNKLNEKKLFHGSKQQTMDIIMKQGFRKEFTSTHVYGEGTYFARDAKYSCDYTENVNGIRKMFLCKVLCGEMHLGNGKIKLKNWPKKSDGLIYDSLINVKSNPSIFVIHDDVRAYPMFVIHYK